MAYLWKPNKDLELSSDEIDALEKGISLVGRLNHHDHPDIEQIIEQMHMLHDNLLESTPKNKADKWTHFAVTANYYGKGTHEWQAVQNMIQAGGSNTMGRHGYIVYELSAPSDIEVSPIDGGFTVKEGVTAEIITDTRKKEATE
jgi:hypothetical protein